MPATFVTKLKSSLLTPVDAKKLGIVEVSKAKFAKLLPNSKPPVPAMWFRYYDAAGKLRPNIWRVRVLAPQTKAFGAVSNIRYLQKPNTPPAAYFSKTVAWTKILKDLEQQLIITEGELKAACACKHGLNCIGLGGIDSWRSKKMGWTLLPELAKIEWTKRDVVIVYDSDAASNPNVARASAQLARELRSRGALPRIATLPEIEGEKVGVDDFLLHKPIESLEEIIDDAPGDDLAFKLHDMNARYIYVREPDTIYDEEDDIRISPHRAAKSALANIKAEKIEGFNQKSGTPKTKEVKVVAEWLEWEDRRELKRFTYKPGADRVVGVEYNLWPGWGVEPKQGDVSLWHELLDHVLCNATPEERLWFERWCAYPIQHPGAKMQSAVCLWADAQGVGKSFIGVLLGAVYGGNYSLINQDEFAASFNAWAVRKQFVLVDDISKITKSEARDYASKLKTLITQQTTRVNEKYLAQYVLPDTINYMLTSNYPDALLIEEKDRRFFIMHASEEVRAKKWYDKLDKWRENDGPSSLMNYLLCLDLGDQDHNTRPPLTESKKDMARHSRADHEQWVYDLRDNPNDMLKFDRHPMSSDLYTARELLALYVRTNGNGRLAVSTLGSMLAKAGFENRVVKVGGQPKRLIPVRNTKKWHKAKSTQWASHYAKFGMGGGK